MKILDSTILIAIISEINYISLIDSILKLNHKLIITSSVYSELMDGSVDSECKKLVENKKIEVLNLNSEKEINDLKKTYPSLGNGEIDSILTYQKLKQKEKSVYCILDDGVARKKADKLGIKFMGFLGLLKLMQKRRIISDEEYSNIIKMLKKSNFRIPSDIC